MRKKQLDEACQFAAFMGMILQRLLQTEGLWLAGPMIGIGGWAFFRLLQWAAPYIASLFVLVGYLLFILGVLKLLSNLLNRLFYPYRFAPSRRQRR